MDAGDDTESISTMVLDDADMQAPESAMPVDDTPTSPQQPQMEEEEDNVAQPEKEDLGEDEERRRDEQAEAEEHGLAEIDDRLAELADAAKRDRGSPAAETTTGKEELEEEEEEKKEEEEEEKTPPLAAENEAGEDAASAAAAPAEVSFEASDSLAEPHAAEEKDEASAEPPAAEQTEEETQADETQDAAEPPISTTEEGEEEAREARRPPTTETQAADETQDAAEPPAAVLTEEEEEAKEARRSSSGHARVDETQDGPPSSSLEQRFTADLEAEMEDEPGKPATPGSPEPHHRLFHAPEDDEDEEPMQNPREDLEVLNRSPEPEPARAPTPPLLPPAEVAPSPAPERSSNKVLPPIERMQTYVQQTRARLKKAEQQKRQLEQLKEEEVRRRAELRREFFERERTRVAVMIERRKIIETTLSRKPVLTLPPVTEAAAQQKRRIEILVHSQESHESSLKQAERRNMMRRKVQAARTIQRAVRRWLQLLHDGQVRRPKIKKTQKSEAATPAPAHTQAVRQPKQSQPARHGLRQPKPAQPQQQPQPPQQQQQQQQQQQLQKQQQQPPPPQKQQQQPPQEMLPVLRRPLLPPVALQNHRPAPPPPPVLHAPTSLHPATKVVRT